MADKFFDVKITITKTMRVRVPVDNPLFVCSDETVEEIARGYALGGKELWPLLIISEHEDCSVESVREVASGQVIPLVKLHS